MAVLPHRGGSFRYAAAGCEICTAKADFFRSRDNSPSSGHLTRSSLLCFLGRPSSLRLRPSSGLLRPKCVIFSRNTQSIPSKKCLFSAQNSWLNALGVIFRVALFLQHSIHVRNKECGVAVLGRPSFRVALFFYLRYLAYSHGRSDRISLLYGLTPKTQEAKINKKYAICSHTAYFL